MPMRVQRHPLPGTATVVIAPGLIILDPSLSRDGAALAIMGLLPTKHPDAVEHWLDQVYARHRPGFLRRGSATVMLVAALVSPVCGLVHHNPARTHTSATTTRRLMVAV